MKRPRLPERAQIIGIIIFLIVGFLLFGALLWSLGGVITPCNDMECPQTATAYGQSP